jgi:hypothetical protein
MKDKKKGTYWRKFLSLKACAVYSNSLIFWVAPCTLHPKHKDTNLQHENPTSKTHTFNPRKILETLRLLFRCNHIPHDKEMYEALHCKGSNRFFFVFFYVWYYSNCLKLVDNKMALLQVFLWIIQFSHHIHIYSPNINTSPDIDSNTK